MIDWLSFCITDNDKRDFSEGDLLAPPTKDYSNLFARPIFLLCFNLNWKYFQMSGSRFGPEQYKNSLFYWGRSLGGRKDIPNLYFEYDLKLKRK